VTLTSISRCLRLLTAVEQTVEVEEGVGGGGRVNTFLLKLKSDIEHSDGRGDEWRSCQSSLLPAFVINLDSRQDRYF
jgi:hypothetical protein